MQESQVVPAFILRFNKGEINERLEAWQRDSYSSQRGNPLTDDWTDLERSGEFRLQISEDGSEEGRRAFDGKKTEVDRFIAREKTKKRTSSRNKKSPGQPNRLMRALTASEEKEEDPIPLTEYNSPFATRGPTAPNLSSLSKTLSSDDTMNVMRDDLDTIGDDSSDEKDDQPLLRK